MQVATSRTLLLSGFLRRTPLTPTDLFRYDCNCRFLAWPEWNDSKQLAIPRKGKCSMCGPPCRNIRFCCRPTPSEPYCLGKSTLSCHATRFLHKGSQVTLSCLNRPGAGSLVSLHSTMSSTRLPFIPSAMEGAGSLIDSSSSTHISSLNRLEVCLDVPL
jgi:hypothetical protein